MRGPKKDKVRSSSLVFFAQRKKDEINLKLGYRTFWLTHLKVKAFWPRKWEIRLAYGRYNIPRFKIMCMSLTVTYVGAEYRYLEKSYRLFSIWLSSARKLCEISLDIFLCNWTMFLIYSFDKLEAENVQASKHYVSMY